MKYTFKLGTKEVTLGTIDAIAAIQPTDAVRASNTRATIVKRFGSATVDDSKGGTFGLALPSRDRQTFERAGWMFVEGTNKVLKAAATRTTLDGASAVRSVYLGRSGTMLGTDLATVQFAADMPEAEIKKRMSDDGLKLVRKLPFAKNLFEVRLPPKRHELEVIQELQAKEGRYKFVEPVLLEAITGRLTPSDPNFKDQWQHKNIGGSGGVVGADIKSEKAWDKSLGTGVKVAVIDNGMRVNHPDLKPGIKRGAFFTSNGTGSANFQTWLPGSAGFPTGDHGTFCLGMAGARLNNGKGGCGSAPESELIPIACLNDQVGSQTTLARAIAYAANPVVEDPTASASAGADVISCSLGPNGADWDMTSVLELAISTAALNGRGGKGIPIFWAATNGPFNIDHDEVCSHPDVMAVSRSNRNDEEDGAGFGPRLEFLAPGVDVYSTSGSSGFSFNTGCSFSAPLAAGVAALVLAKFPTWTRDKVRQRLRDTCDKIGGVTYDPAGKHPNYGYGRLNAEKAVQ